MNPTHSPTPAADPAPSFRPAGPPAVGSGVVEFVRGQRQTAAYLFLGLSLLLLGATVWLAVRGFRSPAAAATPAKPAADPLDPAAPPDAPKPEIDNPRRGDYTTAWIGTALAALATALVGAYLLVGRPKPTAEAQRTDARVTLLAAGGFLGAELILWGVVYFYRWSDSLTKWLDKHESKEMLWVVIPLLMVVAGAGLVFTAAQPARAEERNNRGLRRLVYGANFGLATLLLFVVLVVANVVVALKVPNKLDTTSTGFYSLSAGTRTVLGRLSETVTAHAIIPDSGEREYNDIRQLMTSAQDAGDGKFVAKFVSPVTNKSELQRLQEKYPKVDKTALGILLTVGADGVRSAFIPAKDLFKEDSAGRPGGSAQVSFVGEAAIVRELRFLADNEQKPVVYFTQANGELSVAPAAGPEGAFGARDASQLRGFLERNYLDVKGLDFPPQNPAVPSDAAVVVVADPRTPLAEGPVKALREYMTGPRKGKLIVLAGANPGVRNNKGVSPTGLEEMLAGFGVRLGDKFVYSAPSRQLPPAGAVAVFSDPRQSTNPIIQTIAPRVPGLVFPYPREVAAAAAPTPEFQVSPLMVTLPRRPTWLEDDKLDDPYQAAEDLDTNEAARVRKGYTSTPRTLAVTVAEGAAPNPHGGPPATGSGRLVVVGNGVIFTNEAANEMGGGRSTPPTFDLLAVSIDWLRDRPPIAPGIESKPYVEYNFPEPSTVDTTRLIWLPLALAMLLVTGLGAGVWVIRRK